MSTTRIPLTNVAVGATLTALIFLAANYAEDAPAPPDPLTEPAASPALIVTQSLPVGTDGIRDVIRRAEGMSRMEREIYFAVVLSGGDRNAPASPDRWRLERAVEMFLRTH